MVVKMIKIPTQKGEHLCKCTEFILSCELSYIWFVLK